MKPGSPYEVGIKVIVRKKIMLRIAQAQKDSFEPIKNSMTKILKQEVAGFQASPQFAEAKDQMAQLKKGSGGGGFSRFLKIGK